MFDQIHVKDLLVRTIIGINDDERVNRQDVLINFTLFTDISAAAATDNIEQAVNYRTVSKNVIALVEESEHQLIETLAHEIAQLCLQEEQVHRVIVTVEKPGAIRFANSVGVTIERTTFDGQ